MGDYILAIDQGTTSSRAIVFSSDQKIVASSQKEFEQHFPDSGWVEHDAEEIWQGVVQTCKEALSKANISANKVAGIGITNQRETTIVWNKNSGELIHKAIVWQDRRTAELCARLKAEGHEDMVSSKSGLLLDPYFSATKIAWLLDNVEGARSAAENGELIFGTVDCYLLWKLTGGKVHKTDATNAARTMLFNIHTQKWDVDLCKLFNVPAKMLPEVEDCNHLFGETEPELFGAPIKIAGIAGDQHAATLGQACFEPGMLKSTYGTGCFAMLNTGETAAKSTKRLLTTIAYRIDGKTNYALEGSIFIAGAAVQWLRDGLKIIESASQTGAMAQAADPHQKLILVPAFAGLGAPYWEPNARGAVFGLTRNSGPEEFARATLEAVCFQTQDLVEAMLADFDINLDRLGLRVDGGMVTSDWTMQFLSDSLNCPVDRPEIIETTALGAAWLAGYATGIWPDQQGFAKNWALNKRFSPQSDDKSRQANREAWKSAVAATIAQSKSS